MRLIYADELAEELSKRVWYKREDEKQAVRIVKEFPTVDAVPVVFCAKCKHTKTDGCGAIYCKKWDRWEMPSDFYCKYGERKGGAGECMRGTTARCQKRHIVCRDLPSRRCE